MVGGLSFEFRQQGRRIESTGIGFKIYATQFRDIYVWFWRRGHDG